MAAPTGPRESSASNPPGFKAFPFAMGGRPPEDSSAKEPEKTGEAKKKPCRACTDFKSWMKLQKKQSTAATQVTRGQGRLAGFLEDLWECYFQYQKASLDQMMIYDLI